ncbi:MAG: UTP--glucose-1-phosphate uridylyltransferase GalU [Euryarchaeota archaeon]|nr:UTP--glucose-1-phosphate uridylyltransferase GalU [Euryarchaeota archaeon]
MKAVIPAAGLGTRFLPITKAQPKEMLPVYDKPAIQYVVEEAVASGIEDILIITGRGKRAIEDHFDRAVELELVLNSAGKSDYLKQLEGISNLASIHFIRQKEQRGLGDAVYCARRYVGNEPFAVLLGDTITIAKVPCTKQLINVFERYSSSVIAVEKVGREKISSYGIIKGKKTGEVYKIEDLVEKPRPKEAPSDLGIIGRYILTPEIFECIEKVKPGVGGEIQLTDALRILKEKQEIYAYEFKGKRYDIGNKLDWLKSSIEIALNNEEIGNELRAYLRKILKS